MKRVCYKCGYELKEIDAACTVCGSRVFKHVREPEQIIVPAETIDEPQYDKLGGWLVLFGVGRVLSLLLLLLSLPGYFSTLHKINRPDFGSLYTKIPSAVRASLESLYSIRISAAVLSIIFDIVLLFLLFKRKKSFPKAAIAYCIVSLVFGIIVFTLSSHFSAGSVLNMTAVKRAFLQSMASAILWTAYFIKSERVKKTFIVP